MWPISKLHSGAEAQGLSDCFCGTTKVVPFQSDYLLLHYLDAIALARCQLSVRPRGLLKYTYKLLWSTCLCNTELSISLVAPTHAATANSVPGRANSTGCSVPQSTTST